MISPSAPTSQILNRIYLEVTNRCNLNCRICIRNTWEDLPGSLSLELYHKILREVQELTPIPEIFFGGYGEPLSHPDLIQMVRGASQNQVKTALITNGTLLTGQISEELLGAGLDRLWVSLDGLHAESFQDEQLGEYLPQILQNIKVFQEINSTENFSLPDKGRAELGLAFVLTRKNAPDLTDLIKMGQRLGVRSFFITLMEAYSEVMAQDIFYPADFTRSEVGQRGSDPEADPRQIIAGIIQQVREEGDEIQITGSLVDQGQPQCPFVDRGAAVVRWDGEVSPCLPLLYSHATYIGSWKRQVFSVSFGNVRSKSILEIWDSPGYKNIRERLLDSRYSPCVNCRDCWLSEDNLLDCMGFEHPTCGGCLWAAGLIQCP